MHEKRWKIIGTTITVSIAGIITYYIIKTAKPKPPTVPPPPPPPPPPVEVEIIDFEISKVET
ncbi:MAG: hypothetical protein QME47_07105 [Candidatus Thermoplasmatota archaeon]|nr:hypothetical protein [Candidatus Thermoplasmatota archaeon]